MCGCKTVDMGVQSCKMLLEHINCINDFLIVMRKRYEDSIRISKEVLEDGFVRGKFIESYPGSDEISFAFDVERIKPRDDEDEELEMIRTFFSLQLGDIRTISMATDKVNWILDLEPLFDRRFSIERHRVILIKYIFNLGDRKSVM